MDLGITKNTMREEIVRRIIRFKPKLRIKVLIHDKVKHFNFGPKYPDEDISSLVAWIQKQYLKCKGMKEPEKTMFYYLGEWKGIAYADVVMVKEFDGENHPIVEFESQLT